MTENLPAASGAGWLTSWLENGKIPGAAKAIAQLIGSVANAGSAWINIATVKGQQIQQSIKDDTDAGSVVSKALAKAAAKHGVEDTALVERAVEQWAGARFKAQSNRESIAQKTAEALSTGEPIAHETPAPEEEWIDIFGEYAEKATTERMQRTWARVLEGEIRKPGTFSYRTLALISVLDASVARDFEHIARYVTGNIIVGGNRFDWTQDYGRLASLREFGIFTETINRRFTFDHEGKILLRVKSHALLAIGNPGDTFEQNALPLTRPGCEIYDILSIAPSLAVMRETAELLLRHTQVREVAICYVTHEEGQTTHLRTLDTVERPQ